MSLVTRCPTCSTAFRVLPAQLSARSGRVRCGQCSAIFDGVANLLTEEAIAALPDEPSPQLGLFDGRAPAATPQAGAEIVPAEIAAPVAALEQASRAVEQTSDPLPETPHIADVPAPQADPIESLHARAPVSPPPAEELPAFLTPPRPRARFTLVWGLFSLLAMTALAAQAALHFRSEISVLLPPSRPYLETACDTLGCEVRLPRRAELMSIESSDLQADTQRKGIIVLNALLRNRAPFAQEYPDLELTLTDQSERPVIRRVINPGEYLQQKRAARALGIAGGAEEPVRIFLETAGIPATGYQLFLFYPCPPPGRYAYWQLSYPSRCLGSRNR